MTNEGLMRCWKPKVVLVVMRPSDDLTRIVAIVRQVNASGAKVVVVQLPSENGNHGRISNSYQFSPPAVSTGKAYERGPVTSILWMDLTSRAFVLRISCFDEIASLARAAKADRVILTAISSPSGCKERAREYETLRMCAVPALIIGRSAPVNEESLVLIRRILVAASHRVEMSRYLNFACGLAQHHQASLSLLHICDQSPATPACDGSPVTVASRVPIESLRSRGLLCPMEVIVRAGDPAEVILVLERQRIPDLIVVPAPERADLRSRTTVGFLDRVIAEARCPVMILDGLSSADALPSIDSIFSLASAVPSESVPAASAEK